MSPSSLPLRARLRSIVALVALTLSFTLPSPASRNAGVGEVSIAGPAQTVLPDHRPGPVDVRRAPVVAPSASKGKKEKVRQRRGDVFRGLGVWVDLYDLDALEPRRTAARLRRQGVRTIYLETGTSRTDRPIIKQAGAWLAAAHGQGIKVVGWYLPTYGNLKRDVARTVAIARYRYKGQRFDGIGIDIEDRGVTKPLSRWNRRVLSHARQVRKAVGARYPVAAIPPSPLQMKVAPGYWAGFPWPRMGKQVDAVMLMAYWSDRSGCPQVRAHCASGYTVGNVTTTRRLVKNPAVVIHIIGGVGDSITAKQVKAFVRAAKRSKADGASLYDLRTTRSSWWKSLRQLRTLS